LNFKTDVLAYTSGYKNDSTVIHEMTTHAWEDTVFQFLLLLLLLLKQNKMCLKSDNVV